MGYVFRVQPFRLRHLCPTVNYLIIILVTRWTAVVRNIYEGKGFAAVVASKFTTLKTLKIHNLST